MTDESQTTERKNPLLERVSIPGEKFRLPSGGLFYNNGELDSSVKEGEVTITPMNAMDELILKSPDKLLSGEAITDVFARCLPDVNKPDDLLAKDVDFLLMALRMISYGPTIELRQTHDCEDAKEHSYSVPLRGIIQKSKSIDPTTLDNYKLELESGQVVELHPPRYLATIKVYQMFGLDASMDEVDNQKLGEQLIESIGEMISSVDGHTDAADIQEWLKAIRVGDVQMISDKVAELSDWGVDPVATVKCKDCGEEMEILVPINPISFFT